MKRFHLGWAIATICFVLLAGPAPVQAEMLGLTFTGGALNDSTTNAMAGWRFNVNTSITVNGLGFWDEGGNGLNQAHQVGIWTNTGVLVASGIVSAGTVDPLESGFRIASIAPITLDPGIYRIAAYYGPTNTDPLITAFATVMTIPEITYLDRAFLLDSGGFTFPTGFNSAALAANFGPTFSVASGDVIPEPSSLVLAVTGMVSGLGFAWQRRRRDRSATST